MLPCNNDNYVMSSTNSNNPCIAPWHS